MKNSEQAIEKVLSGLNGVEAPSDMERRILRKLQNHTSLSAAQSTRSLLQSRFPSWLAEHTRAFAIATACGIAALLVVLITPAIRHTGHATAPSTPSAQSAPAAVQPSPTEMTAATSAQAPTSIARKAATHHTNRTTPTSAEDDLAEREMRAPSLPAPPMPLTDQEKLLLRLVHANDPVELALIDSKSWATQFTRSKAQFDKFFAPPKTAPTGDQQ